MTLTRVSTYLPADLESLVQVVIGGCLTVHRELGPGMSESVYHRACQMELKLASDRPGYCAGRELQRPRVEAGHPSRCSLIGRFVTFVFS
jgi:hypothetical protein